jgi:hypothetical protein
MSMRTRVVDDSASPLLNTKHPMSRRREVEASQFTEAFSLSLFGHKQARTRTHETVVICPSCLPFAGEGGGGRGEGGRAAKKNVSGAGVVVDAAGGEEPVRVEVVVRMALNKCVGSQRTIKG